MPNTFKVVSHDVMPASAGTPEDLYTAPSNTTTIILGLVIANVHTSQVTADVKLVSDTSGGGRSATNTTTFLLKDAPIPASSALQVLDGGAKFVLQSGDALKVQSDTASSVDVWVSRVDTISS